MSGCRKKYNKLNEKKNNNKKHVLMTRFLGAKKKRSLFPINTF